MKMKSKSVREFFKLVGRAIVRDWEPKKIGYYEAMFHAGTLTIVGGDFERASVYSRRAISNAGKIPRISPLEDSYYTLHITRLNTLLNPHCNIQLLPYNPSF